jgi:hypothetical protein
MTDVSRNVVAILLVLVIAVSAFGTWSVLSSKDEEAQVGAAPGPSTASVSVAIRASPMAGSEIQLSIAEEASG